MGLGAQDAVAGGGRYNGLAKALGGPDSLPAIGFAIGEDRLRRCCPRTSARTCGPGFSWRPWESRPGSGPSPWSRTCAGITWPPRWILRAGSLKAQMSLADRLGATHAVLLGDKELATGLAQVRPMKKFSDETGGKVKLTEVGAGRTLAAQEQVPFEDLVEHLTGKNSVRSNAIGFDGVCRGHLAPPSKGADLQAPRACVKCRGRGKTTCLIRSKV